MAAKSLSPRHPTLHYQLFQLRQSLKDIPQSVNDIISSDIDTLFQQKQSPSEWNNEYLAEAKGKSAANVQAALKVRWALDPQSETRSDNEKSLLEAVHMKNITLKEAEDGLSLMASWGSSQESKEQYKEAARKKFGMASAFKAGSS